MSKRTRLAAFMADLGLHQYQVAAVVGMDPIRVSRYRRGLEEMSPAIVEKFCVAFDIPADKITGWDDDENWDDPFDRRVRGVNPHSRRDY